MMKKTTFIVALLLLGLNATFLTAQTVSDRWLIGAGGHAVNYNIYNDTSDGGMFKTDNWSLVSPLSTFQVARALSPSFSADLFFSVGAVTNKRFNINDEHFINSGLGLRYKFTNNYILNEFSRFDPFLRLGINYNRYDFSETDLLVDNNPNYRIQKEEFLSVAAGAGFNFWVNKRRNLGLNFGFDYNIVPTGKEDYMNFAQANAGVVFRFGAKDTDGDGIFDSQDECIETPGLKEFNGCPDTDKDGIEDRKDECVNKPGLAEFNGCPDTDKDGIEDRKDACPLKPGIIEFEGCPDTDEDGLPDHKDNCPTVPGPKSNVGCPWGDIDKDGLTDNVDKCPRKYGPKSNNGCPLPKEVTIDNVPPNGVRINFGFNKTNLTIISSETLDRVYEFIQKSPNSEWKVVGHTDNIGADSYNLRLSQRRAQAVVDYFVNKKGMDASKITAEGKGESQPLDSEDSDEARAKNRRVEIYPINK